MTTAPPTASRSLVNVPLDRIADNPWQPRGSLDPDRVKELAASIAAVGLLQPPLARLMEGFPPRYELAFGHYRVAALRLLGQEDVDVDVRNLSDAELALIALVENVTRNDVRPIEQYRAWKKALDIEGMTIQKLADSLGLDRSTVSNNLRLLQLPAWLLDWVDKGELSAHGAREFLCLQGADGHFHEEIALQVIAALTSGAPDWRVGRVRLLIAGAVTSSRVNDWRKLFAGHPGGSHAADPEFDFELFKQDQAPKVHSIPNDEWEYKGAYEYQLEGRPGRVVKERGREWTCATAAWVKVQNAAKAEASALAGNAAAPSAGNGAAGAKSVAAPGKTSNFAKQLRQDPVYRAIATDGKHVITVGMKRQSIEPTAAELGTRAAPRLLNGKEFKAFVDALTQQDYVAAGYGSGATKIPSYFPDIKECRERCTIGATYARLSESGPLYLFCLNQQHFEEKLAVGREKIDQKLDGQVQAVDEADAAAYAALKRAFDLMVMPPLSTPGLLSLIAATLLLQADLKAVEPDSVRYDERRELLRWPANAARIAALAGAKLPQGDLAGLDAVASLSPEDAQELMLRLVVNQAGRAAPLGELLRAFITTPDSAAGPAKTSAEVGGPQPSRARRQKR